MLCAGKCNNDCKTLNPSYPDYNKCCKGKCVAVRAYDPNNCGEQAIRVSGRGVGCQSPTFRFIEPCWAWWKGMETSAGAFERYTYLMTLIDRLGVVLAGDCSKKCGGGQICCGGTCILAADGYSCCKVTDWYHYYHGLNDENNCGAPMGMAFRIILRHVCITLHHFA